MHGDSELLRAWRGGDEAAGKRLFKRYYPHLLGFFINKTEGADQAFDLTQDTFLACVKGRDRIVDDDRFRSYLFGVAYNVLKGHLRHRYRLPEELSSQSIHDLAPGAESVLGNAQEERLLAAALRRIPIIYQVVIEMSIWQEMSSSEISEALGIPASTVRSHRRYGRELLEQELRAMPADREVVESTVRDLEEWATRLRQSLIKGSSDTGEGENP